MDIHNISGIVVGTAKIGGVRDYNVPHGATVRGEATSGLVYPRIQSITAQNPRVNFTTNDLAIALGTIGLTGCDIGANALALYCAKFEDGASGPSAGVVHRKISASGGIIVPRTLAIDHQGDATLTYEAIITHDGTNNPLVLAETEALPTGFVDDTRFTIGPVELESINFTSIQHLAIDFGFGVTVEGGDSALWPTIACITAMNPKLTITGKDIAWWKDAGGIPLEGLSITHVNTAIYLRKRAEGGSFVADATEEHIAFTACGLAVITEGFAGSQGEAGTLTAEVSLNHDGTNAPLTMDLASALP